MFFCIFFKLQFNVFKCQHVSVYCQDDLLSRIPVGKISSLLTVLIDWDYDVIITDWDQTMLL